MIQIALIENKMSQVLDGFELANEYFFNNEIEYHQFASSQSIGPIEKILQFDVAIIDISLSTNSDQDGFHLIKAILDLKSDEEPGIIILTGQTKVKENMKKFGLPTSIPIIYKPVSVTDITQKIKEVLDATNE